MLNKKADQKIEIKGDKVHVSRMCTVTKRKYEVVLRKRQYDDWKNGAFLQNVAPSMPADHREFLISGTTPEEWNKLFKDVE